MKEKKYKPEVSFLKFLRPFAGWIIFITILGLIANAISLVIPRYTSGLIDQIRQTGQLNVSEASTGLIGIALSILFLTVFQILLSSIASERVALVMRKKIIRKISEQNIDFVTNQTPSKLLTNLTSDVDALKAFVSQGFPVIISAIFLAVGATLSLFSINSSLAVIVLIPFPIIVFTFFIIFGRLIKLFTKAQENIDNLNQKITETIYGSSLIRVLNAGKIEEKKFEIISERSKILSTGILKNFGMLLPIINLIFSIMIVSIIYFGGSNVIDQTLTLGEFNAFYQYSSLLLTPVFILGFVSSIISRSISSYNRIAEVLETKQKQFSNLQKVDIEGNIELKNITLTIEEKEILKEVNLSIKAKSRVAIIGPTAGGKSQLLNILAGLTKPTSGEVFLEGVNISEIDPNSIFNSISIVFQDSIIFNSTLRENITLGDKFTEEEILTAVSLAELSDIFEKGKGLDTVISERGASLSGGQKQRLTLARALIRKPKVLILDDFTARVDASTERKIVSNILNNFAGITLISISQKIEPIKEFDQIILLMEGELIATGKHDELLANCFEYKQIYNSQKSIN